MVTDVSSQQDAQALLDESSIGPVVLLKHSTRCGISTRAATQFDQYDDDCDSDPDSPKRARVLVVEYRPVSMWLAEQTGVAHQSPQVMLISGGQVVWHASHFDITADAIADAVSALAADDVDEPADRRS